MKALAVGLLCVRAIAEEGSMPRHADYQADSSPVLLGSWGQTIKKAGTPEESAWDEDDLEGYVEALRETRTSSSTTS
jgi:hypothetical protein